MTDTWALFDRLADRYDEVLPFFATFGSALVEILHPVPGTEVLDLGTGRGAIAAAAVARGCRVTAIDPAPRMVERLRADLPAVDGRVMDARALDFADDSFDVATAGFMIHVVDDPAAVLAEARRVVRPGGTVALTVPGAVDDGGRWTGFNDLVGEFRARQVGPGRPGQDVELPDLLAQAGFVDIREVPLAVHLPVDAPQTVWDFQMSHGFAGFVESLTPADQAEFRERALAELATMRAAGGLVLDRGAEAHLATVP